MAVETARESLAAFGDRAVIVRASYASLDEQLERLGWQSVDGILLDLGLSSMQLESSERGFSFDREARLDMRFDPSNLLSADEIVNEYGEKELADILFNYGEERKAKSIARAIVKARPVQSTSQLAHIVNQVAGQRRTAGGRNSHTARRHPATRTFQALRIAVNKELENLERALPKANQALAPAGRLAVISFHSLEDRIVKRYFRRESQDCICPPGLPVCTCGHVASLQEITRRPVFPGQEELSRNPRSRSARLRVAQKVGDRLGDGGTLIANLPDVITG